MNSKKIVVSLGIVTLALAIVFSGIFAPAVVANACQNIAAAGTGYGSGETCEDAQNNAYNIAITSCYLTAWQEKCATVETETHYCEDGGVGLPSVGYMSSCTYAPDGTAFAMVTANCAKICNFLEIDNRNY